MTQELKFKRDEIIAIMKKNRDGHRDEFEKAQKGFREDFIQRLDRMLDDARKGRAFVQHVGLQPPMNMTKEYDKVIRMFELTTEDELILDEREFAQYIMDDWGWKEQVSTSNRQYIK